MTDVCKLLPTDVVCDLLSISRSTLQRYVAAGKLPQPVRFGRTTRWREDYIARVMQPAPAPAPPVRTRRRDAA